MVATFVCNAYNDIETLAMVYHAAPKIHAKERAATTTDKDGTRNVSGRMARLLEVSFPDESTVSELSLDGGRGVGGASALTGEGIDWSPSAEILGFAVGD